MGLSTENCFQLTFPSSRADLASLKSKILNSHSPANKALRHRNSIQLSCGGEHFVFLTLQLKCKRREKQLYNQSREQCIQMCGIMGRSSRNFLIPLFISSEIITIFLHSTAQQGGNCTKCSAFKSDITNISENQTLLLKRFCTTQDHPMQCYIYEKQNKIKSRPFPVVSMFV